MPFSHRWIKNNQQAILKGMTGKYNASFQKFHPKISSIRFTNLQLDSISFQLDTI